MNEAIAYHEAGHAVACLALGIKFKYVTIIENDESNSLGHIVLSGLDFQADSEISDKIRLKVEKYISVCLAGPIAEAKFTGSSNDITASKDYEMSFVRAANLLGPTVLINAFMNFMLLNTETLFTYLLDEEEEISNTDMWDEVKILANELMKSPKLKYYQVHRILPYYK